MAASIVTPRDNGAAPRRFAARRLCGAGSLLRTRRPPRRGVQERRELLGVELRHAGGAVAARLLAGRDEKQAAVLDALHRRLGNAGRRRVALVVGGVDGKERRRDLVEARRRVVGGRGFPGVDVVVGVGGERRREALVDELVGRGPRRRELLVGEVAAVRAGGVEHGRELHRFRLLGVIAVVV